MPASNVVQPRRSHLLKRWLYIAHRWIGIVTCLLFAIWFISGLVMVYVPFPALDKAERLAGLAPINWNAVRIGPLQALRAARIGGPPRMLAIEMRDREPVWRIDPWNGPQASVSASSGRLIGATDSASARRIASDFGHVPVREITSLERDQWTVAGSFDWHRPLWKVDLKGPRGRVLYVSSRTGAVVLDTDARERFWNWLGSVPHWIYPTVLRQDNATWRQVVMWVSGPCIVGAITGMWIGIMRTRMGWRRFSGGRMTPYRGWMKWHHISGLVGGLFLTTWIFSGWLSVDPFRLFSSPGIRQEALIDYAHPGMPPAVAFDALGRIAPGAKRIELRWVLGRAQLAIERDAARSLVLDAVTLAPLHADPRRLRKALAELVPGASIVAIDRLTAPDAYWYGVDGLPTLPVLRVKYDDPAHSWVHIDPETGIILGDTDTRRRLYRWAFDLLHRWDLNMLTLHRPAREMVLWTLSLLGIVTSLTGIRIAWSRLRRRTSGNLPAAKGCYGVRE